MTSSTGAESIGCYPLTSTLLFVHARTLTNNTHTHTLSCSASCLKPLVQIKNMQMSLLLFSKSNTWCLEYSNPIFLKRENVINDCWDDTSGILARKEALVSVCMLSGRKVKEKMTCLQAVNLFSTLNQFFWGYFHPAHIVCWWLREINLGMT